MLADVSSVDAIYIVCGLSSEHFYLKPQIRAISVSSSVHNGLSSLSRLPYSITLRIISIEGTA